VFERIVSPAQLRATQSKPIGGWWSCRKQTAMKIIDGMIVRGRHFRADRRALSAFTLTEVVISVLIVSMMVQGVVVGYVNFTKQAEWTAHSLAAQSLASQGLEQARSAKWDPQAWPQGIGPGQSDELGVMSYMQTNTLDIPMNGQPIIVTNFISVTTVSDNPSLRQIRSDCVWSFMSRGLFTNTVITLRSPD
jgi:type II secretory pathway pseudopilin PulG